MLATRAIAELGFWPESNPHRRQNPRDYLQHSMIHGYPARANTCLWSTCKVNCLGKRKVCSNP